jgi:hypothetical protein
MAGLEYGAHANAVGTCEAAETRMEARVERFDWPVRSIHA